MPFPIFIYNTLSGEIPQGLAAKRRAKRDQPHPCQSLFEVATRHDDELAMNLFRFFGRRTGLLSAL